ncbi:dihydroorotate dehydrogenase electron transfer subunit [Enhygromyxa salina]|uniref:dihydroorotate dehydrogenase electron transfer subunit n=1 Tax=Enhygromyxa salina TaxID=215803 RepID=UPI0011B284FB|nr:dihydroorotate dehydrogenase electron transfer subunit [Enhygromyxa salina]
MATAQFQVEVAVKRPLTGGYFVLELASDGANPVADAAPGQFVMLRGDWGRDLLNGRAFSVLEPIDSRRFSVLFKVFGRGTALMRDMTPGDPMTVTGPLGHGFPQPRPAGPTQILVAGGVGLPPLHLQARLAAAAATSASVEMFYGGRGAEDLVLTEDLERWGVPTVLATEDGSRGEQGRVTAPVRARLERAAAAGEAVELLACGPTPMLRAVRELGLAHEVPTYLCLEEMMACGFGVCLGCAVPVYGPKPYKYCCTDGPVFEAREVRW